MAHTSTQSNVDERSANVHTSFTHWANHMTGILAQRGEMYVAWFREVHKELVSDQLNFAE